MSELNEAQSPSDDSPPSDVTATAGHESAGDVTAASSTADEKPSAPSADPGAKPKSLSDVLDIEGDKLLAEEPPTEEAEPAGEPEADPNANAEPADEKDADPEDTHVPFHKHPRWQEKQRQVKELTQRVSELESRAEIVREIEQHTGGEQGFNNLRTLARTFAEDPAQAVPMLKQLLSDAEARGGLTVTDASLKERLDAGLVDEETALELQQARLQRQKAEQQRAEHGKTAMRDALDGWQKNIEAANPDWKRMQPMVQAKFVEKCAAQYPQDARAALAMVQSAYDEVLSWVQQSLPKPRANNPLRAVNGQGKPTRKPTSLDDSMDNALREMGLL